METAQNTAEKENKVRQLWGMNRRVSYWPDYFEGLNEDVKLFLFSCKLLLIKMMLF
jgi:hypothetical protein